MWSTAASGVEQMPGHWATLPRIAVALQPYLDAPSTKLIPLKEGVGFAAD